MLEMIRSLEVIAFFVGRKQVLGHKQLDQGHMTAVYQILITNVLSNIFWMSKLNALCIEGVHNLTLVL